MEFIREDNFLLLKYSPQNGTKWIRERFKNNKKIHPKRTFHFTSDDKYSDTEDEVYNNEASMTFILARKEGDYYKFKNEVLGLESELYMHEDIEFEKKQFVASKKVSVFRKFDKLVEGDIRIGDGIDDLPIKVFYELVDNFPNYYELRKYTLARIGNIIREYLNVPTDAKAKYEKYINKKHSNTYNEEILSIIAEPEIKKYTLILEKLENMLEKEEAYSEKKWQKKILEILKIIYPKYIEVFEEVSIRDNSSETYKRVDYLLLDSNGNVDIIEIKKPFDKSILHSTLYRGNHVPCRDLSGTIMQVENYIYLLNQWGIKGEEKLRDKYSDKLPDDFKINIVNPNGIIIMGREKRLNEEEKNDFEIIKRKYNNIVDIITYDELINRLKRIISKFRKH